MSFLYRGMRSTPGDKLIVIYDAPFYRATHIRFDGYTATATSRVSIVNAIENLENIERYTPPEEPHAEED